MNTQSSLDNEQSTARYRRFQLPIVYVAATVVIVSPWLHGTARSTAHILAGLIMLVLSVAWWRAHHNDRTKMHSGVSSDAT